MADYLYGRACRVLVSLPVATPNDFTHTTSDVLEINGEDSSKPALRVQFKIDKTSEKEPNTSQVTVTNLAPTRQSQLQVKGVKLQLEAGYQTTGMTRIFRGDVRTVDQKRDGGDWNTLMKLGDGERSFRYARLSESFAPGTGAGDVLKRLANASGLAIGNIPDAIANITTTFDQGYVVNGSVQSSIDRLVKSIGYEWSIQDETLQVLRPGTSLSASIPQIDASSGLIGSPEMGTPEKKGKPALVKFQCLLIATKPGAKVKLVSKRYDGFVHVKKCSFEGDTHGDSWFTTIEGIIV